MKRMNLGEPENDQIDIKTVQVSVGYNRVNSQIEVKVMELSFLNIVYWLPFRHTHITWCFFLVLASFLGALNLFSGSTSFLKIDDARYILAKNARWVFRGAQMLYVGLASLLYSRRSL
ncbi:hypothetical protein AVEN_130752-1 [Araneus ventricosus]|uniref:Uncharacterized protein n=1 Tax=Araneus ventricosus TaxID=182803 RepID=A0A4Y2GK31_ARAVE|nr:hypothetical protein AVEN_130752-1 [Araneus ventricosus]